MSSAPLPTNEKERLSALRRYDILDTPAEDAFNRITALAARLFSVPMAAVSLIDHDRQWFKAGYGLQIHQTERQIAFCSHAILLPKTLVIPDARCDLRFCNNPLVTADPHIRFYAGAPLITPEGFCLGTLNVIDRVAREFSEADRSTLEDLAAMVVSELELRRSTRDAERTDLALRTVNARVAALSGNQFFNTLVEQLTEVLGVACAFVSELQADRTLRTIAVHGLGGPLVNCAYSPVGTPCERILQERTFGCYSGEVHNQFALDGAAVESYAGVPLIGLNGDPVGVLGIMDSQPLDNPAGLRSVLPVFAARAGMEWERMRSSEALKSTHDWLELTVQERTETLRQREEELQLINDAVPVLISFIDADARYRFNNRAYEEWFGEPRSQVYGRHMRDVLGESAWASLQPKVEAALRGETVIFESELNYRGAGTRYVSATYVPRLSPQAEVSGFVAVVSDLSERKRLEDNLARLYCEAREANQIKDEFLMTVSHELRTPLNAILGWVQILRKDILPPEKARQALETIERNARAQNQLIEDILDVSRIITGKLKLEMRPVELSPVVAVALDAVRLTAAAKQITLISHLDDQAGVVQGDINRLQQVLWNLFSNAVKFTPTGGRIEVRTERTGAHVIISVSDTGIGIAPEFLPHIFERFRQVDSTTTRQHSGLGLGLAIVRHLVEMHGGTIDAASPGLGQGAVFTVTLPLQEEHGQSLKSTNVPALAVADGSLAGLRVMVVDDELDGRELVKTVIEAQGAEVIALASAREALAVFSHWHPDLLVSDIGMPGEDGYSLIRQVRDLDRQQSRRTAAIALTAYARPDDRARAFAAGYQIHLPKPVEPDVLLQAILDLSEPLLPSLRD